MHIWEIKLSAHKHLNLTLFISFCLFYSSREMWIKKKNEKIFYVYVLTHISLYLETAAAVAGGEGDDNKMHL